LVEHGHAAEAVALVERRSLRGSERSAMRAWLQTQYEARGDLPAALEIARGNFFARPSLHGFADVRRLAEPQQRWPPERTALLEELLRRGDHALLVEPFLSEVDVDPPLEPCPRVQRRTDGLRLRRAQRGEPPQPRSPIPLS